MTKAILTMVLMVAATPAFAQQRPLVTEDPETVGAHRVLVESGFEFDRDQLYPASGLTGNTTHGPTFGLSVGLSPSVELQVDGGVLQRIRITGQRSAPQSSALDFTGDNASSFEDLTAATKVRILSESADHPGFGLRFGTKLPTAQHTKGMGLGTTDFFVSGLVAKTVQSVRTVGNVSLLILGDPTAAQSSVRALGFGVSVARAITNEFEAVGEVNGHLEPFGAIVPAGLESRGTFRIAGRYTYDLLRLDLGLVLGMTSRDPAWGITAGATYVIGK